ncbi:MAG: PhzF family phenazine biosynthesis protein [Opitutae bacterium]|nr:PhzF family phenazine biosynthesis protein [Opitutae bacterium]
MKLPLYWIDAFSSRVFRGNPAAVVPLESWLDDEQLRGIAFENGLSETAFLVRTGEARYRLRWFTPAVEVDLCGHATLASAHVLFRELGLQGDSVTFETRSGELRVARAAGHRLELDFPSLPNTEIVQPTPELLRGLGRAPELVLTAPTRWLCVYASAAEVRELKPDHVALAQVKPGRIIVTAPGEAGDCDFVSRYFAPDAGIPEDPVTGSAHCTLAPYWAERLGRAELHARQVSARGGKLWCKVAGDRVKIAGESVCYLRGEIEL